MAEFRSPTRGGNVVHNLDFPMLSKRRGRRIVDRRRGHPAPVPAPVPLPAYVLPAPAPARRPEPAPVERESIHPLSLQDDQARKQIDVLERRLAKMARLLDQRDVEFDSRSQAVEEDGVASIYKEVQGLDGAGKEGKQKKALMSSIFEANVKLREMVTSASSDAD